MEINRKINSFVYSAGEENFFVGTFQGYSKKGKLKVLDENAEILKIKEKDCLPPTNLYMVNVESCQNYLDLMWSVTQYLTIKELAYWDCVLTPERLRNGMWNYLSIEEDIKGNLLISAFNTGESVQAHENLRAEELLVKLSALCQLSAQDSSR